MASVDSRFIITKTELANLNDWLTRLNYDADCIEFRTSSEPGIGQAITAYVELHDDEGYFKLLTAPPTATVNLKALETALTSAVSKAD